MELNNHPRTPDPSREVAEVRERLVRAREVSTSELTAARTRIERVKTAAAERARRMSAPDKADRLELSSPASALVRELSHPETDRSGLVSELKAAYESGTVNSRERIEKAATHLLGGE